MKLNISVALGLLTFAISIGCYAISIERRFAQVERTLDIDERVGNLEKMLFPILVEMKFREKSAELVRSDPSVHLVEVPPAPGEVEAFEEAENWAEQQIQRAAPTFRKEAVLAP